MGDEIKKILIFASGLVIGSAVTWKLVKGKYEEIANEEIQSIREYYNQKETSRDEKLIEAETVEVETNKPNIMEYAAKLENERYVSYSDISKEDPEPEEENKDDNEDSVSDKPYVISPDEFGEFEDYDTINLTYYSNGIVTDDFDEKMTNDEVEAAIGWMNLTKMGEYEPDALHVRNEIRKVDYEILQVTDEYLEE